MLIIGLYEVLSSCALLNTLVSAPVFVCMQGCTRMHVSGIQRTTSGAAQEHQPSPIRPGRLFSKSQEILVFTPLQYQNLSYKLVPAFLAFHTSAEDVTQVLMLVSQALY